MSSRERATRLRLKEDFEYYAEKCLKIRAKDGSIQPLNLNKAQKYVHQKLESQLQSTGKIRALILKGRQQGQSTYVEGRFYWKSTHRKGVQTFILTHEQKATDNLFKIAKRYHDHCPPQLRPATSASSSKELVFQRLDSGYGVATAGSKAVGRSSTIQYFHGSEVAFWPHADEHAVGVMQAISDAKGTEIILESTANGVGNYFHDQWKKAEAGESDFIAIFVPWFWQDEYTREVDESFELSQEEEELKKHYKLTNEQIAWRRNKIVELSAGGVNGSTQFKQEYPMNAAEAFQMSGKDTLITAPAVMRARKNKVAGGGSKILGVDPSLGKDRFALIMRQGAKMYRPESYVRDQVDTLDKRTAIVANVIIEENPDAVFIDAGFGVDLADNLRSLGYKNISTVAFGGTPLNPSRYINKRGEMYGTMADWLNDENCPVSIPDRDDLQADLCATPYYTDANNRVRIEAKDKIKKDFGFSPDLADASALTFARPVTVRNNHAQRVNRKPVRINVYKR